MKESLNKNQQPKTEKKLEQIPPSSLETGAEPAEEMLKKPLHDMTKEDWEAERQQWKQEGVEWRAGEERRKKEHYEKWERRTQALESIQPTGDIVEDAEAFFEAVEITGLEEFDSHYGGAFSKKDSKGILQCFKDYEKNARADFLPPETDEAIVRFFRTFDEVVKKIISAYELVEEKKKPEKSKE